MDPKSAIEPSAPTRANATILVVDDEPANLGVLNALLQPHYRVRVARSGADALIVAVAHKAYRQMGSSDFLGRLAPGGCVLDVKSALDLGALRREGCVCWRL